MPISPTTDLNKMLEENALRLYRLITAFKNEYGYNSVQSSIRATIMFLMELMKDQSHMSVVEMKMLISKLSEIELNRRHLPLPKLVKDSKDNKFYDLRGTKLSGRLKGASTDIQLLQLPMNTLTILIIPIMNDVRLRLVAFTDNTEVPFIEIGDLIEHI